MSSLYLMVPPCMRAVTIGSRRSAFTLVELLVVVAIIGILATIVLVGLGAARIRARDTRRVSDLRQLQTALQLYADAHGGDFPTALTDLVNEAFLTGVPKDPLGASDYAYAFEPAVNPSFFHLGASLEENGSLLNNDRDCNSTADPDLAQENHCNGVGAGTAYGGGTPFHGDDSQRCLPAHAGSFCYDLPTN